MISIRNRFYSAAPYAFALVVAASAASAQTKAVDRSAQTSVERALASKPLTPAPRDPYPLTAAGWGPDAGHGLFASRWVEDWGRLREAGLAPRFKAMPLGSERSLTLSAEARLRYDGYDNGLLKRGNDYEQSLFRAILGADMHLNSHLRVYGEVGTGQVLGRRAVASASFQNDASLQQLFIDARGDVGAVMWGAMLGRQEFADGPKQLISLGDGSNSHRTWNGLRVFAHGSRFRVGAFDFRATRQRPGVFDEQVNSRERLRGLNASVIVSVGEGATIYFDPFWYYSQSPRLRNAVAIGVDDRDTVGARVWGRSGALKFDWTLAQQTGNSVGRDVHAWGLFTVHSLELSDHGWKPRLTAHVDFASGGGVYQSGATTGFNPLYASSSYLGDGQFLALSNLLMIAPGVAVSPTSATSLALEYGVARRLDNKDAIYAGGLRVYAGTAGVRGRDIGDLLRLNGTWSINDHLNLFFNVEYLNAGAVLNRAQAPSASYAALGATIRY